MYEAIHHTYDERMRSTMTPEQWTTILSQLGVGGALLVVIVKVIVPMIMRGAEVLASAIRDGNQAHTSAVAAHTQALEKNTAAVSSLAERVAHLEGRLDQAAPAPATARGAVGR